jgi:hypothetical protein
MEETAETIKGQIENEKLVISTEIVTFDLSVLYQLIRAELEL